MLIEARMELQRSSELISALVNSPSPGQDEERLAQFRLLQEERIMHERKINRVLGIEEILRTPEVREIQAKLPINSILIDFFVQEGIYAWVLSPIGDPLLIYLGSANLGRIAKDEFLDERVTRGGRGLSSSGKLPASGLFGKIWAPLKGVVGEAEIVFICPDRFLCELPFGIFRDTDGTYLLERHNFIYLSDPTRIANDAGSLESSGKEVLLIGGVDYSKRGEVLPESRGGAASRSISNVAWKSLPGSAAEVLFLENLHSSFFADSSVVKIVGANATEERIRAEISGREIIHISTHGYFEPGSHPLVKGQVSDRKTEGDLLPKVKMAEVLPGLTSGLVCAGVNDEIDDERDDGYLSAEEIQHLDLSSCQLVVLSACETALGSPQAGEGLLSLRRAFSVAGAGSVVSSLWKVSDRETAELMKDFYTNLWQKGMSRGSALHQAKLRMLKNNRAVYGEDDVRPATWGAFVLSGEWN